MKVTAYVSHEDCPRHDTGWGSPDHQGRLPAVARAVYRDMLTLFEPLLELSATPATEADLLRVHTPRHVAAVREAARAAGPEGIGAVDGVRLSAASWEAAAAATGTALTAVDAVLAGDVRNAFASARPEGRDARPDAAAGFSLLNHVAVAAKHAIGHHGLGRVLVVAWGGRAPAGIAASLAGEPGVSLVSVHGGAAADLPGIALPAGSGGAAVEAALREALAGVAEDPDLVLLSASFDLLAGDPLGDLAVEPGEVHALTAALRAWADARAGGRLVSVLEGGYDAGRTARAVVQHLRALAGLPPA